MIVMSGLTKHTWILIVALLISFHSAAVLATDGNQDDLDFPQMETSSPIVQSPDADEVFLQQPEAISYVSSKITAKITCKAKDVDTIHVKCNNEYLTDVQPVVTDVGTSRIVQVDFEVTKRMVFEVLRDYFCLCIAQQQRSDGNRQVNSRRGQIKIASLKKPFHVTPLEESVESMTTAELKCSPPDGEPRPSVSWQKDGKMIDAQNSPHYIVTSEGSLLINQATEADQGNYSCIASNGFMTRRTEPARLLVYTNGGWSLWSPWSPCATTYQCGDGSQQRWRICTKPEPSGRDGRNCEGDSQQSSPCTKECPPVDGQWSVWGEWEPCEKCQKYRYRHCNNPEQSGHGKPCSGTDVQPANCTDSPCREDGNGYIPIPDQKNEPQNIILWVILCAAVALFAVILIIIILCLIKKKNRRSAMYDTESNEMDGSVSETEKFTAGKGHATQPDLTKSIPLQQARSYTSSRQNSVTDNHTIEKMPMLPPSAHQAPGRDYYMQISPSNSSSDTHDYMQIGHTDVDNESSEDKISQQSSSPESGICNSCDRQSLLSAQIPNNIDIDALSWGNLTHTGGRLAVTDSGISVTIPEGAISRNQSEEVYLASLREDKDRPILLDKQTLLSPVILCGPQGNTFNKSLILSLDHCASLKLGQWKISIYSSQSSFDEQPKWERLITLNQEILHAPVYCQMDNSRCHIMVDQLASRYCLVGESMYGSKAVKHLKLAAFSIPYTGTVDYSVRVYVLPDLQDALHSVVQQESKLGAQLMDKPKQISFQDGGNNLCLMIDSMNPGWVSKLPAQYQEIPFRHIWNGQMNLHCSFSFERANSNPSTTLSCKIQVYQKSVLSNRQTINITNNLESSFKVIGQKDLSSTVTVNTQSSSGCSSMITLDQRDQLVFKLPTSTKKKLASHLDMPCMRGNDWRMLAAALSSDRQLNFFASKPSPTEAILDLWEARTNVEECSVAELSNILRAMGRQDAASILERELINAWV